MFENVVCEVVATLYRPQYARCGYTTDRRYDISVSRLGIEMHICVNKNKPTNNKNILHNAKPYRSKRVV